LEAKYTLDEMMKFLAIGIKNLVNTLNPDFIVLGGMGYILEDEHTKNVIEAVNECSINPSVKNLKIIKASLDISTSTLKGCTILAMDNNTNIII